MIELTGDIKALERETKRVIKQLPHICCDTMSMLFIMQTLLDAFKEASGYDLPVD